MSWSNFISKIKPDGKAFRNISYTKYLYEVIAYGLKLVADYAIYKINDQIWYVNDNFDPEPWENRYSINVPTDATLAQRREVVKSYMLYPQSDNRLCLYYLQLQLNNAGFEEVTISQNPTGAAYSKLHGNNITDTENYTIGSQPYNSILISGNLSSDYYRDMIILMMSIKPLDTAVYDIVTSDVALAILDSIDYSLAIGETFEFEFGELGMNPNQFDEPNGIIIFNNQIYVCDRNNNRVQIFDLLGNYVNEFKYDNVDYALAIYDDDDTNDYTLAVYDDDDTNDYALAVSDSTMDATGIAINSSNIYVVDSNSNQIIIFDSAYNFVSIFGATGTGNGQFDSPYNLVLNSTNIFIVDSGNNRIQIFDLSGNYVSQFGTSGTGNGEFNNPKGIAINDTNIFVVDSGNGRVQKFDLSGNFISEFGEFDNPIGITINDNYIFVCDSSNGRVQKFDLSGNLDFSFNTSENSDTAYNQIVCIAENQGDLYITDYNNKVKKYSRSLSLIVNQI